MQQMLNANESMPSVLKINSGTSSLECLVVKLILLRLPAKNLKKTDHFYS